MNMRRRCPDSNAGDVRVVVDSSDRPSLLIMTPASSTLGLSKLSTINGVCVHGYRLVKAVIFSVQ